MAKGFSYVVARDYGFAPNPFRGYCTLATCKPKIRQMASIGDYVFGFTPTSIGRNLVYAMKVAEKMTFNEYWDDSRFQCKKPVIIGGSMKTAYGDNIYYKDTITNLWSQANSHHSLANGEINEDNLRRDTSVDSVLVGIEFFYFGSHFLEIPKHLIDVITRWKTGTIIGIGQKELDNDECLAVWNWLLDNYKMGIIQFPALFTKGFERYDGK